MAVQALAQANASVNVPPMAARQEPEGNSSPQHPVAKAAVPVGAMPVVPTDPIPASRATPKHGSNARRARIACHAMTEALVKTVSPVKTASLDRMPIWAACASANRAHAAPPQVVNPIRCAPASIPCAPATGAKAARAAQVATEAVAPAVATAAQPIRCGRASVASADAKTALFLRSPSVARQKAKSEPRSVFCLLLFGNGEPIWFGHTRYAEQPKTAWPRVEPTTLALTLVRFALSTLRQHKRTGTTHKNSC